MDSWTDGEPDDWTTNGILGNGIISQVAGVTGSAVSGTATMAEGVPFVLTPTVVSYSDGEIGFPVDADYPSITFQYKFAPVGSDVGLVTVGAYDVNDNQTGAGFYYIETATNTWTTGALAMSYFGSGTAYMQISASISNLDSGFPTEGSNYTLDNFALSNNTVGVDENTALQFYVEAVYPNPTRNDVNISFTTNTSELLNIEIYDLSGKLIKSESMNVSAGAQILNVNLSGINSGLYLIQLKGQNEVVTQRLKVLK